MHLLCRCREPPVTAELLLLELLVGQQPDWTSQAWSQLFSAGIAPSTRKNYQTGTRRFTTFCEQFSVSPPFPVSERSLMAFVAFLHWEGLSGSTVKNYLAAVRHSQISLGWGDPNIGGMPRLDYVVKGLKRLASTNQRPRLPITPEILQHLKVVWETLPNQRDAAMLWAAATMCFFGFLRVGEAVSPSDSGFDPASHLTFSDVRRDTHENPRFLRVHIKASKTDPFRKGVFIFLGRIQGKICPVAANLDYMVRRGG